MTPAHTHSVAHRPRAEQQCGNCDAFHPLPERSKPQQGMCRAGPPTIQIGLIRVGNEIDPKNPPRDEPGFQGMWPPVTAVGWCRQWSERHINGSATP